MIVEPRPAATVILLRDGDAGLETFVMERASTMAFAPRMHVFPGGRVDPRDYADPVAFRGTDAAAMAERGSSDIAGMCALYACAVRETAEETGVDLSVRDAAGNLVIDVDRLPLVDHWVTPEVEGRRYDVRFFAAVLPPEQSAALTTTEAVTASWITPGRALEEFAAGRMAMLPPTEHVLRFLVPFAAAADVLAAGGRRTVVPLLPRQVVGADGVERWMLVHDRTGEVVQEGIPRPHTSETDGTPTSAAQANP